MSNKNLINLDRKTKKIPSSKNAGSHMRRRFAKGSLATLVAGIMLASGMAVPANAALSQTGPVDPVHGFPTWFADQNGLRLELCFQGALCLAALPDANQPLSFPGNFPDEAFWWAADASIEAGGVNASLVMAQEAAFANETAQPGEQTAFSRLRIRITGLTPGGVYVITHPYGTITLTASSTGVINYTNDFGCFDFPCSQASYDRALNGPVSGPFLQWGEGAPAGYIGDPEVAHTVVGSPLGTNFFRVEGPNIGGSGGNSIQTDLFAIQGKIFGVAAPDPVVTPDPVDEEPVEEAPVEEAPVEEAPVEEAPVEEAPVEEAPVEEAPVEEAPVEEAPVEEAPVEEAPVEEAPVEEAPVEEAPVEEAPVEEAPVEEAPVDQEAVKAAEDAAKAEAKAAEETAKAEARAAEDAAKAAEKATKDAAKAAEETAKAEAKAAEGAAKAAEETAKANERAIKDAAKAAEETAKAEAKAAEAVVKAAEKAAKDAAKTAVVGIP